MHGRGARPPAPAALTLIFVASLFATCGNGKDKDERQLRQRTPETPLCPQPGGRPRQPPRIAPCSRAAPRHRAAPRSPGMRLPGSRPASRRLSPSSSVVNATHGVYRRLKKTFKSERLISPPDKRLTLSPARRHRISSAVRSALWRYPSAAEKRAEG